MKRSRSTMVPRLWSACRYSSARSRRYSRESMARHSNVILSRADGEGPVESLRILRRATPAQDDKASMTHGAMARRRLCLVEIAGDNERVTLPRTLRDARRVHGDRVRSVRGRGDRDRLDVVEVIVFAERRVGRCDHAEIEIVHQLRSRIAGDARHAGAIGPNE